MSNSKYCIFNMDSLWHRKYSHEYEILRKQIVYRLRVLAMFETKMTAAALSDVSSHFSSKELLPNTCLYLEISNNFFSIKCKIQ